MMGEKDMPSEMMGQIGMPHAMHAMQESVTASEQLLDECEMEANVTNGAEMSRMALERELHLLQTKTEGKRVQ